MEAVPATADTLTDRFDLDVEKKPDLQDLLEDGIYMLFMLRDGTAPHSTAEFNERIDAFLGQFERHAKNFGKAAQAIEDSKYAFCALMDEIVLKSQFKIRDDWERNTLQLRLFGEHLAGEGFFDRLEAFRLDPPKNVEVLEIYYRCLLLGFQGKYLLEGKEKLGYLTTRVGQEIAGVRGEKAEFAPHWKPVFRFQEFVHHQLPLWVFYTLLLLVALVVFYLFSVLLGSRVTAMTQARRTDALVLELTRV